MGTKDAYPLGYLGFALAAQTVYADNPNLQTDVAAGKATYANSEWVQVLQDLDSWNANNYFEANNVGTSYQSSLDLVAAGKAAMLLDSQAGVASIRKTNPSAQLGIFALPYGPKNTAIVPTYVDVTLGIAQSSKHVAAARKFLAYFADANNAAQYITAVGTFPTFTGVTPKTDPALQGFIPAVNAASVDLGTKLAMPTNTILAMEKGIQSMFAGTETPQQVAQDMDKAQKS